MTTPRPRAVSRFVLVAVAVPVVVIAGAVLLQLGARDALPDPIAIHWGADGAPDGFGAPWVTGLATVLVGLGVPLLIAASAVNGLRRGDRGPTYRLMGALAAAMSAGAGVLMTSSVLIQRGLADAAAGPSLLPWLVLAGLIAIGVGVAGWLVQPDERLPATGSIATMDPPLTDGERAVWLRSVHLARAGVVVLCAAWALLVVVAVITLTVRAGATVATMRAIVGTTHFEGAPEQMMMAAPAVPRGAVRGQVIRSGSGRAEVAGSAHAACVRGRRGSQARAPARPQRPTGV